MAICLLLAGQRIDARHPVHDGGVAVYNLSGKDTVAWAGTGYVLVTSALTGWAGSA